MRSFNVQERNAFNRVCSGLDTADKAIQLFLGAVPVRLFPESIREIQQLLMYNCFTNANRVTDEYSGRGQQTTGALQRHPAEQSPCMKNQGLLR